MKIKEGYILKTIAGNNIVVGVGAAAIDFNGMINLNDTGAELWRIFEGGATADEAIKKIVEEYEIDEDTARTDVEAFIEKLRSEDLVEE